MFNFAIGLPAVASLRLRRQVPVVTLASDSALEDEILFPIANGKLNSIKTKPIKIGSKKSPNE